MTTWGGFYDACMGKGLSAKTTAIYVGVVRRLAVWCDQHGYDLATVPPHAVRTWADQLPPSHSSRKQAIAACRMLWAGRDDQPWQAIRVPRKPRPDPQPLDADELVRLLAAADLVGGRAGMAVHILCWTGARPSEVAGMMWDGYDGQTLTWWRSKTSEEHRLPVHPRLRAVLDAHRRESGAMFAGDRGRPHVTPTTVAGWVRRVGATVDVDVTPRRLRASVATRILDQTGSLEAAAAVLGHRSTDTTRRYARTSDARLEAAIAALG